MSQKYIVGSFPYATRAHTWGSVLLACRSPGLFPGNPAHLGCETIPGPVADLATLALPLALQALHGAMRGPGGDAVAVATPGGALADPMGERERCLGP